MAYFSVIKNLHNCLSENIEAAQVLYIQAKFN